MRLVSHYRKKTKDIFHVAIKPLDGETNECYIFPYKILHPKLFKKDHILKEMGNRNILKVDVPEYIFNNPNFVMKAINNFTNGAEVEIVIVRNPVFEDDIHIVRHKMNSSKMFHRTPWGDKEVKMAHDYITIFIMNSMRDDNCHTRQNDIVVSGRFHYNAGASIQLF